MLRTNRTLPALIVLGIVAFPRCGSFAEDSQERDSAPAAEDRLDFMKGLIAEFDLFAQRAPAGREAAGELLTGTAEPVLRYSNPVRNFFSDGATFLWLDQGRRPVAAGTISIRGAGAVWGEFCSFSQQPLRCVRGDEVVWTPSSASLVREPVPGVPDPAASSNLWPLQMRQLARRFTVTMAESDEKRHQTTELRLLPTPIYKWSDEEAGIEGAVFSFSETTDPEAFLILELVGTKGEANRGWRFSLARMTSHPLEFRIDERKVLTMKGYWANPRSPSDPYVQRRLGNYEPPIGQE